MSLQEEAYRDYLGGMKYKDIADKHGVTLSAVKSWATRYWKNKKVATKIRKVATKGAKLQPRSRGGQIGNVNAVGKACGAKRGNQWALKQGLFAKYLPEETLAIVTDVETASPLDILWANIKIKFAAIIRAQKIMYVADDKDNTVFTETNTQISIDSSGQKRTITKNEKVTTATDKQVAFLNAQSRAMATLTNMIRQYEAMANELGTEEQRARVDKLRAEVNAIGRREGDSDNPDVSSYVDALRGEVAEVWEDGTEEE